MRFSSSKGNFILVEIWAFFESAPPRPRPIPDPPLPVEKSTHSGDSWMLSRIGYLRSSPLRRATKIGRENDSVLFRTCDSFENGEGGEGAVYR